jgi:hypothetical protein
MSNRLEYKRSQVEPGCSFFQYFTQALDPMTGLPEARAACSVYA